MCIIKRKGIKIEKHCLRIDYLHLNKLRILEHNTLLLTVFVQTSVQHNKKPGVVKVSVTKCIEHSWIRNSVDYSTAAAYVNFNRTL